MWFWFGVGCELLWYDAEVGGAGATEPDADADKGAGRSQDECAPVAAGEGVGTGAVTEPEAGSTAMRVGWAGFEVG